MAVFTFTIAQQSRESEHDFPLGKPCGHECTPDLKPFPAPLSADPGGRRRMNVDRHYETFACFCSLTLFVSSCPTNSFFPLPKVILDAPLLSFQQLSRSPSGCCAFPRLPRSAATPTLPQLNLLNTRIRRNPERLPSSRCIESAQNTPYSCVQLVHSSSLYSARSDSRAPLRI